MNKTCNGYKILLKVESVTEKIKERNSNEKVWYTTSLKEY